MWRLLLVAMIVLAFAWPAVGMTYKTNYPVACSDIWPAVKEVLSHPDEYDVVATNDAEMNAAYNVKHTVHVNLTGAILQRTNHVKLVTKGTGCEMQVGSNYSGPEHNDQGDFRRRVEEAMAKQKAAEPVQPVKSTGETK